MRQCGGSGDDRSPQTRAAYQGAPCAAMPRPSVPGEHDHWHGWPSCSTGSPSSRRGEGLFDEGKGKGKQAWGDLTDNEQTKGEGQVDELKGKGEQAVGDIKDAAGDVMDNLGQKNR